MKFDEVVKTDESVNDGSSSLMLDALNKDDEATYRCRASNDYGAVFTDYATLHVKGRNYGVYITSILIEPSISESW